MNFIEQLQQSPKWTEFEEWYYDKFYTYGSIPFEGWYCNGDPQCGFVDLNIDLQKGVFEKFIESRGCNAITWVGEYQIEYCLHAKDYVAGKDFSTFEELLIWYFNN